MENIGKVDKLAISIAELASVMSIGLNNAYKLVRQPGFPTMHIGSKTVIPVDRLKDWLNEHDKHSKQEA